MMGDQLHVNGGDRAGSRCMYRAGQPPFRSADDLTLEHVLADLHHRHRPVAGMLMQGNDQLRRQGCLHDRGARRFGFMRDRMHAAVEFEQRSHDAATCLMGMVG